MSTTGKLQREKHYIRSDSKGKPLGGEDYNQNKIHKKCK